MGLHFEYLLGFDCLSLIGFLVGLLVCCFQVFAFAMCFALIVVLFNMCTLQLCLCFLLSLLWWFTVVLKLLVGMHCLCCLLGFCLWICDLIACDLSCLDGYDCITWFCFVVLVVLMCLLWGWLSCACEELCCSHCGNAGCMGCFVAR